MAILRNKKIRELSEKDLREKSGELRLELSKEMASSEIGAAVKNPGRIREIRRTIARIKTENGARENKKRGGSE